MFRQICSWGAVAALCSTFACGFSDQKQNAERVTEGYFNVMAAGLTDHALDLFADSFFEQMPREKWQANLDALPEKLGGYKKHELSNWNVHFQAGAPAPGVYTTLVYTVHYSKFDATETFVLYTRDKQAEPKIVGHHIQSDAFLLQ